MALANFWFISRGTASATGGYNKSGYTVHFYAEAAVEVTSLKEAQKLAVKHGASGKFVRRTKWDGPRLATYYFDMQSAEATQ